MYILKMRKLNIIFATDLNNLFGVDNLIPWNKEEATLADLRHFNRITQDSFEENVIVSGRKTYESLPCKLRGRVHVVLTTRADDEHIDADYVYDGLSSFIADLGRFRPTQKVFIVGGAKLIEKVYTKYFHMIENIYYTRINHEIAVDGINTVYFEETVLNDMFKYVIREKQENAVVTFYHMRVPEHEEFQYLRLVERCLSSPERSTRNAVTMSMFNETITFDLNKGFPLLTTKKVFMRGIFEELIFFLRGETNSKLLEEKGVNIWKPNTSKEFIEKCGLPYEEGDMGPMYGYNWKYFGAEYRGCKQPPNQSQEQGYNQIEYVMNLLQNDPFSRRILMTTYNPAVAKQGVLYPCHSIVIQFYVTEERVRSSFVSDGTEDSERSFSSIYKVSMSMYQRSVDVACGLPFNIASNALLLNLVCKTLNTRVGEEKYFADKLHIVLGDIHIYSQHKQGMEEQMKRLPHTFPILNIKAGYESLEDYKYEDIEILGYQSHPAIKYEMVA
jgi:dihydrofolate reductase/thymidylate synthase